MITLTKPNGISDAQWAMFMEANAAMLEAEVKRQVASATTAKAGGKRGVIVEQGTEDPFGDGSAHYVIRVKALEPSRWFMGNGKNWKGTEPYFLRSLPKSNVRVEGPDGRTYELGGTINLWMREVGSDD